MFDIDRLPEPLQKFLKKPLPAHLDEWPWALGAIPMVLFGILAASGILLTFYYVPYGDRAYDSVRQITEEIRFGWLIRGVHQFSVHLMIAALFLHMIRVYFTEAWRKPGEPKWVLGALIFITTLLFAFTGYSLVYDQLSYWGMTVVTNMVAELPVIGDPLMRFLRGGGNITAETTVRFYHFHTKLLPVFLMLLIVAHIALVRLIGIAPLPKGEEDEAYYSSEDEDGETVYHESKEEEEKTHPFYPDHVWEMGIISMGLLVFVVNMAILFPPDMTPQAAPGEAPLEADIEPPWYFVWAYRLLKIVPLPVVVYGLGALSALFILYPWLNQWMDRRLRAKRGTGFRKIHLSIGVMGIMALILFILWETAA